MTTDCQAAAESYDYAHDNRVVLSDLPTVGGYTPRVASTGERVRIEREARGWTLEDLASRSGVDRVTLNRIELGKQRPQKSTLRTIEAAFDASKHLARPGKDARHGSAIESGGAGIEDRLADLFLYIKTLDEKTRGEFIRGLVALLTALEQPRPAAARRTAQNDGR